MAAPFDPRIDAVGDDEEARETFILWIRRYPLTAFQEVNRVLNDRGFCLHLADLPLREKNTE